MSYHMGQYGNAVIYFCCRIFLILFCIHVSSLRGRVKRLKQQINT